MSVSVESIFFHGVCYDERGDGLVIFATPLCDEYKNTLELNGKGAFLRNVEPP